MYPDDAGIRSQLEWTSSLSTANAPVPTEKTKFLRKVWLPLVSLRPADTTCRRPLLLQSVFPFVGCLEYTLIMILI